MVELGVNALYYGTHLRELVSVILEHVRQPLHIYTDSLVLRINKKHNSD